ncbi:glycosyltransferase family 4 protein [Pedobacter polaris]|uniref:Glycosyltransferase family 4 protein n=1 Tax=Pedobacter polaris TaxID=2571273 RepID=A0A4U1CX11_9SPHI|nr:glycosyltransferase family 1 protein [Pedobacter polaris]TKC12895.1 glycosyltransferase family 4 protein [Pedobacter polaris]
MKILFDGQIFSMQKFGGISRYFTELIYELNQSQNHQATCPIILTKNIHYNEKIAKGMSFMERLKLIAMFKFSEKRRNRYAARQNRKNIVNALACKQFDLFVPTYYDPYFLPLIGDKPYVLNVYDLIHEIFPTYFKSDDLALNHKAELIEKATKIIAISSSTKKDILKFYPNTPSEKIEVVHLAGSIDATSILDLDLPKSYILFVGNRAHYKNFDFFFKAIAPILKEQSALYLVCAGGNEFSAEELALICSHGVAEQVIQRNFKDVELATYYVNAQCFVFPSVYEGFGIPVLESMSCGCPVVLANHSSFPEVAGDAGIYFELEDEVDLRTKVSAILANDELREEFKQKGLAQCEKFSWEKTAKECISIFNSIKSN